MKRLLAILLVLCLLLCGCGKEEAVEVTEAPTAAPTEAPTEPPTEPPTEAPTEAPTEPPVVIRNPLNGEVLEEPYTGRIFAFTINNIDPAMPQRGTTQADIYFEMLINDGATRGLAFYTDVQAAETIGSIRSCRIPFVDLCSSYDAILTYAGGSDTVLNYLYGSTVDGLNANAGGSYVFRDQKRLNSGYAWEHCLMAKGEATYEKAQDRGFELTQPADKDYGFQFAEDGTPVGGQAASQILIRFWNKKSTMVYEEESGKYLYKQFGDYYTEDSNNDELLKFENVIVIQTNVYNLGVYHIAESVGTGKGYFACNGQIVPIIWTHESTEVPYTFTYEDGTPITLGVGSSYIALAPDSDEVEITA